MLGYNYNMDYQSFQPNPLAPQTPQISQQTPPIQKNFTPKFIWVVVGLLVLGGVAYGGIWWYENGTSDNCTGEFCLDSGWQTYRDNQNGFEFRYPSDWKLEHFGSYDVAVNPADFKKSDRVTHFSFSVSPTAHMPMNQQPEKQYITRAFGTRTGYIYTALDGTKQVYFPDDRSVGGWVITLDNSDTLKESEQILATFKFTNN